MICAQSSLHPHPRLFNRDYFLSLFAQVLSSTKFTAHEYTELVLPVVQAEWIGHVASPSTLAFDVAHTLAFRRGLGNSLYASPTSPVSIDQVKAYAKQAFAKDNISVLGTGISAGALEKAVGSAFGSSGAAGGGGGLQTSGAQYFGGEQRVPLDVHSAAGAQPTMIIAYGATGASHADLSVLSHLLGGTSSLKWAPGASPLSLAADKISGASAKAFVLPYSDAALFGVVVSAPTSENVKALATEVAGLVKALGSEAKDDALKRAVAKAKFEVASATETKEGLMASFAPQVRWVVVLDVSAWLTWIPLPLAARLWQHQAPRRHLLGPLQRDCRQRRQGRKRDVQEQADRRGRR